MLRGLRLPHTRTSHHLKEGALTTTEKNVEKIRRLPVPANQTEVCRVIGLGNFYRKFIKGYSQLTAPLRQLRKKDVPFVWTSECQNSFDRVKELLTSYPILAMPDFSHDFILRCDASGSGIGGTLSQEVPGDHGPKVHVIAYYSRKLTDTETCYPITQKELLAVVSAVRKYEPMIRHSRIVVYTDHSALVYMLRGSKEQQNSRVMNWLVYLSTMDIKIIYRAGHLNQVADALSRIPQCNNYHDDLHQTTPTKPEEEIPVGFQVSITTHLSDNEVEHRRDRDGPLTRAQVRATKHDRSKQTLESIDIERVVDSQLSASSYTRKPNMLCHACAEFR